MVTRQRNPQVHIVHNIGEINSSNTGNGMVAGIETERLASNIAEMIAVRGNRKRNNIERHTFASPDIRSYMPPR